MISLRDHIANIIYNEAEHGAGDDPATIATNAAQTIINELELRQTISIDKVATVADELLRQASERGEDWPPSLRDFPYYPNTPSLREEYQDQWMKYARAAFRAAGFPMKEDK